MVRIALKRLWQSVIHPFLSPFTENIGHYLKMCRYVVSRRCHGTEGMKELKARQILFLIEEQFSQKTPVVSRFKLRLVLKLLVYALLKYHGSGLRLYSLHETE